MKHKRPPVPLIIILVLAVVVGGYFILRSMLTPAQTSLTASGTIEAVEVTISPEIGGKVAEVMVEEGATVNAGDVLFRLDDTLLKAQRAVASASLDTARGAVTTAQAAVTTAQANYTVSYNAARLAAANARTSDWHSVNPTGYSLNGGYFSQADQISAAQAEVDSARTARDAAQASLDASLADPTGADFVAAEKQLADARAASMVAQDVLTRASAANNTDLRDAAQSAYDLAKTGLEAAQTAYDALKGSTAAVKIVAARLTLSIAQESYGSAQDRLLALQTGENSPLVAAAQAVLHQAQAAADQAALSVAQAEANLALIDAQMSKLTITAPADGTILTSSLQPGEIVAPNAVAMTLGNLKDLTITVYVPEDLYGQLSVDQPATMSVDSFPGETFAASVNHIADQAEFTPRNVQTAAGRSSTVFAVKLLILDPNGKLKPGMPADVSFTR